MASRALDEWTTTRSARLDELFAAHERVGGTAAGRRTQTQQINWALVLRLAAEFQGFARELHDEGVNVFAASAADGNAQLESALRNLLTLGLRLDVGNAEPGSLGDAFGRFGLAWWPRLQARHSRTSGRQAHLGRLNRARNAIAHARLAELDSLRDEGYPMTLDTVRRWRSALNQLAQTMDAELAFHLGRFFGQDEPW
jgi:hypothetical protein